MITTGSCLCGNFTWQVNGEPHMTYNCHCKICRKAHGAAFATYWFVTSEKFKWINAPFTITRITYPFSGLFERTFCQTCGSVLPTTASPWMIDSDEPGIYVPAGCHDIGPRPKCHIFAAHKAPWHTITGPLPRHAEYPPPNDFGIVPEREPPAPRYGGIRGSCLCGDVRFEVLQPFKLVHQCHCRRCRKSRAAAHATNGFTTPDGVVFTKGESKLKHYKLPGAKHFTHTFCKQCGSGMPQLDTNRQIAVTPLGSLDDHPDREPDNNIFVANKADWYEITDTLPQYTETPTV